MQVRQRLRINAVVPSITVLVLLLVVILALYRINKALDTAKNADEIVIGAFEKTALSNYYLRNNNERARIQWFAKHEEIGRVLKAALERFPHGEDHKNIETMIENHESMGKIFSAIVKNREKRSMSADSAGLSQEIEDRLLVQLNMRVYSEVLRGRVLRDSSREAIFSVLRQAGTGIIGILALAIAAMLINSWTLGRTITYRIGRLRNGAAVIGGGDLDYRIDMKGDDEFAQLSEAFDAMTAKLKTSYHDLEKKIEERRRAEQALRESEARYRNLFNMMSEGFSIDEIVLDDAGNPVDLRYLEVNPAFERHTGLKAADITGRTTLELFPAAERVWFERYGKVALTGEPAHFEEWFGPLGRCFEVNVYRTEPGRFAVIFFDITARKRAEEALRQAHDELELRVRERTREFEAANASVREINETLEQRVAERTAEIQAANASLLDSRRAALNLMEDAIAARRELEAANKELESFIYSVSHDLHGPLRSMAVFTKIIAKDYGDRLDEKGRDYLRRIEKAGNRTDRIIMDLLHLSRISRYESIRAEVDLSPLAQQIVTELQESSSDRDVEVDIQEGLTVRCDPQLIELALSNLLGNAWKFTSKTAQGHIAFGAQAREGKTVYYVKDNGAGFDPEYAGKIFLPFHRLHSEDEFEGTGIGLAIVELAIRRHGGKVWAEGEVGKGATVFFTLA